MRTRALDSFGLAILCSLVASAAPQERILFGVEMWGGNANPFLDRVEGALFKRSVPSWRDSADVWSARLEEHLQRYPLDRALPGLSMDGREVRVTIDSVSEPMGDLFETLFSVEVEPAVEDPVLFWTGPKDGVQPLSTSGAVVSPELRSILEEHADSMFRAALPHYMHEGAQGRLRLQGEPETFVVDGHPDLMTVFVPATIEWQSGRIDDRPSVFFIVEPSSGSVVFERFGHPEWSPVSDEIVLTVRPRLFFALRGSDEVYFFGNWQLPWEHFGFGIFELATGELVARSF